MMKCALNGSRPFSGRARFGILLGMLSQISARLKRVDGERTSQMLLLGTLALAVLWRGGRTFETTLLLGAVAGVVLLLHPRRGSERPVASLVWWLVIAFVAWTAVSYLFTTTMNYGFDAVVQTTALAFLFLWMARVPAEARIRTCVLKVLTVSVLLGCLVGVLLYTMGPVDRFVGTFFDLRAPWKNAWPNAWAELLLLTWPVALLLAQPDRATEGARSLSLFRKVLQRSTPTGVMVGCLLLTFSRAALLAFLAQGILLLLWTIGRRIPAKRLAAVAAGTLLIALILFGLSNHLRSRSQAVQSLTERALFQSSEGTSSVTERRSFWKQAVLLSLQRPLTGWGPGSFRFAQTPLMEDVLATSDHAHNVFLNVLAERGWPAALLLLVLAVILFGPLLRGLLPPCAPSWDRCPFAACCRRIPRPELNRSTALLSVALLGVLAHNLIDFNLHFIAISLPATLILAMLATPGRREPNGRVIRFAESALTFVLLAAVLREGFFFVPATLARFAQAQGNTARAILLYRFAEGEWYGRDNTLALVRLENATGALDAAREDIGRYTSVLNPVDARGWKLQGQVALAAKEGALADQSFAQAYALGRFTDLSILREWLPLLSLKSSSDYLDRKGEFTALLDRYYDAIVDNRHFIALTENVEAFVAVADIMGGLDPSAAPRLNVLAAGVDRQARAARLRQAQLQPKDLW